MSGEEQKAAEKAREISNFLETHDFSNLADLANYLHRKWCEVSGMQVPLIAGRETRADEHAAT